MGVSWNRGTPKSSILMVFSIINHPLGGTTICAKPYMFNSPAVLPVLRAAGWFCPGKTCSWMCPEPLGSWSPCSHHAWVSSLLGGDSPTLFVAPFFGFLTVCAIQIAHIIIESYMHFLYQTIYIYTFQYIYIHSVDCWTPQWCRGQEPLRASPRRPAVPSLLRSANEPGPADHPDTPGRTQSNVARTAGGTQESSGLGPGFFLGEKVLEVKPLRYLIFNQCIEHI